MGVTGVLLLSTLFAFSAAGTTDAAAVQAQVSGVLYGLLQSAGGSADSEESLERSYALRPGPRISAAHRMAAASLDRDIQGVARLGDAGDRAFAAATVQANHAYGQAAALEFAALDRPQTALAPTIDRTRVDSTFNAMRRRIGARTALQERLAAQTLGELRTAQHRVIQTSSILSLLAVACLGVVFFTFGIYRRGIATVHAAELRRLEAAALTDNLTKLGNHRAYQEDLHREISRAKRHGYELTLALVDVDDLKLLNDQNGHMYGDRVLAALGSLLGSLRHEDRAYRIGGDEFSVLFPQTSNAQARETMERLRLRAQETLLGGTISAGLASLSPGCDAETLHARADAALYAAKQGGRNRLTVYEASSAQLSVVSPTKVGRLRAMIADNGLNVVFQPIWDVRRGAVLAYEALARPMPAYGFAGPQEAFELAERVGRAHELDAVTRAATLARARSLPLDALLFINMSPQSFARRRLDIASFTAEVRAAGLTPDRVAIEITERSITHLGEVIAVAKQLQSAGFRLALDDVGAGNAGLDMLTELNVDFVKIDRGVIVKASLDPSARGVLAGIIVIAKSTGAYVIAEGIENVEMLELVCRADIDWRSIERGIQGAQGYLLRRPSAEFLTAEEADGIRALVADTLALEEAVALTSSTLLERWKQFA